MRKTMVEEEETMGEEKVFSASLVKGQTSQMKEEEETRRQPEGEEEDVDAEEAKETRLYPNLLEEQEEPSTSQTAEEESWRKDGERICRGRAQ